MAGRPGTSPRARRVTVDDVAAQAGVSQATVSQVLGGSRPVSQATREKVLESIQTLGFRPNQLARSLRRERSQSIAFVVPNIMHEVYPAVARGIGEVVRPLGYQVAIYDTDNDRATERHVIHTVGDRMTDGMIAFGFRLHDADLRTLDAQGIVTVNGGFTGRPPGACDSVQVSQDEAFRDAVLTLGARYRGPIAHIGGPRGHSTAPIREAGFRAGMAAGGFRLDEALVIAASEYSAVGGRDALTELLGRAAAPPRLVICANDLLAIGAISAAVTRGLRVPEDIAISGYDNIPVSEALTPPLTTMDAFQFEQGRTCARLMLERLAGDYTESARHVVMPARLIERASA